jgi:hypothetical protein
MNSSEQFRKFAAECQAMAKFARSPESKATWNHLAARWIQCAELAAERYSSAAKLNRTAKRHRTPGRSGSHPGNAAAA